jgi:hypothetical protein
MQVTRSPILFLKKYSHQKAEITAIVERGHSAVSVGYSELNF